MDDEKLRFDFSHTKAMTVEQIKRVEAIVNDMVGKKLPVDAREVARWLTLRKYRAFARCSARCTPIRCASCRWGPAISDLLSDPSNDDWKQFSIEFCGGTHLANTGDAERFVVMSEEGTAKGIRRVVGATRGGAAAALAEAAAVAARVAACESRAPAPRSRRRWPCSRRRWTPPRCPRCSARGSARRAQRHHPSKSPPPRRRRRRRSRQWGSGEEGGGGESFRRDQVRAAAGRDGRDAGALKDAAAVAFKAGVACALFSADPARNGDVLRLGPPAAGDVDVKGWLNACCGPIEGKGGGGKNGVAQGQGNKVDGLDAAVAAAEAFVA